MLAGHGRPWPALAGNGPLWPAMSAIRVPSFQPWTRYAQALEQPSVERPRSAFRKGLGKGPELTRSRLPESGGEGGSHMMGQESQLSNDFLHHDHGQGLGTCHGQGQGHGHGSVCIPQLAFLVKGTAGSPPVLLTGGSRK